MTEFAFPCQHRRLPRSQRNLTWEHSSTSSFSSWFTPGLSLAQELPPARYPGPSAHPCQGSVPPPVISLCHSCPQLSLLVCLSASSIRPGGRRTPGPDPHHTPGPGQCLPCTQQVFVEMEQATCGGLGGLQQPPIAATWHDEF